MLQNEYYQLLKELEDGELTKVLRAILDYIYWENEDHEDERRNG